MAESLDFTDQQNFADAQRRLVARAPDNDDFTIVLPWRALVEKRELTTVCFGHGWFFPPLTAA